MADDDDLAALRQAGAGATDDAVLGVPAGAIVIVVQAGAAGVDVRVKPDPREMQMLELARRQAHLEQLFYQFIQAGLAGVGVAVETG